MFEMIIEGDTIIASFQDKEVCADDCMLLISCAMKMKNPKVFIGLAGLRGFKREADLLNLVFLIRNFKLKGLGFCLEGVNSFVEALIGEFVLDIGVFVNR